MTRLATAARPSYRRALAWIIDYDDTDWLDPDDDGQIIPSVTASLVADLFGHSDDKVIRDLQRRTKKAPAR